MIDSNNQFNRLTRSLVDATRKIMEAKEGTHPKTDREKDLAAKAPPHDKITHADVLAARGVLKKHPTTGKMVTKEEAEAIDELSKKTMTSFLDKTEPKNDFVSGGEGKPGHEKGRKLAFGKLARKMNKEDVEEIEELSKNTVRDYYNKAGEQGKKISDKMKMGGGDWSKDGSDTKTLKKRAAGRDMALKRRSGEMKMSEDAETIDEALDAAARYGQHHVAIKELLKSIDHHVRMHKDDALKHRDYRGKKGVHWGHVGDVAQVHSQLADIHDRLAQQGEYKATTMGESVELDEAPVDGVAAGSMDNNGHLCATKVFHKEWAEGTPIFSQHAEPDADGDIAWYDVMFEHGIEKGVSIDELDVLMSETHERHGKRKMKEETSKLDDQTKAALASFVNEARGRPRKNPLPVGQSDEPEPRQHIMQQLQRAKLSMRGGEHVTFKDGTKHHVAGHHAEKILARYSGMRPAEKEDFQKKIGASHTAFKAEL